MSGAPPGQRINIHACCVLPGSAGAVFGAAPDAGVLILGDSGAGKSTALLQFLARGGKMVADDRCDLFWQAGKLCAAAPENLAGLMEVRGVGILRQPFVKCAKIALAVQLGTGARLPEPAFYTPPDLTFPAAGTFGLPPLVNLPFDLALVDRICLALAAFEKNLFYRDKNPLP